MRFARTLRRVARQDCWPRSCPSRHPLRRSNCSVAVTTAAENAPFFSAVERGMFAKLGLDVKVDVMPSGVEIANALASGTVDVGLFGTLPVPDRGSARRAGRADRPYVEQRAQESAERGAVGHRACGRRAFPRATSPSSRARRSASRAAPAASRTSSGLLKQVGLSMDDVTLVNTAPSSMATALANKDADVIAAWEPWPSAALTKVPGSYKVIYGGCKSCYDAGTLVTTKSAIADKAKAARARSSSAMRKAQAWARANRDEAAKISTRWIPGMDAETLTLALKSLPLDVRLSKNTLDGFKTYSHPAARRAEAHPGRHSIRRPPSTIASSRRR